MFPRGRMISRRLIATLNGVGQTRSTRFTTAGEKSAMGIGTPTSPNPANLCLKMMDRLRCPLGTTRLSASIDQQRAFPTGKITKKMMLEFYDEAVAAREKAA